MGERADDTPWPIGGWYAPIWSVPAAPCPECARLRAALAEAENDISDAAVVLDVLAREGAYYAGAREQKVLAASAVALRAVLDAARRAGRRDG